MYDFAGIKYFNINLQLSQIKRERKTTLFWLEIVSKMLMIYYASIMQMYFMTIECSCLVRVLIIQSIYYTS